MKSKSNTIVMLLLSISLLVSSIWAVSLGQEKHRIVFQLAETILVLCFALFYTLKGYGKNAALSYKLFMHAVACLFFAASYSTTLATYESFSVIRWGGISTFFICAYICLCLAMVSDLGKKKAFILVYVILGVNLLITIGVIFIRPGTFRGGDILGNAVIVMAFSRLFLCLMAHQMVSMKYQDKEARGTK